ncbi:hypothetical protein PpBr36_03939 [Pyricularia pennisetigena]|uniref:hypothetical protein n=1 Tax=Pyricularia pennisetigena TaxID=1578925 RepID=UPI001154DBC6|nr:hypothetical protein PpBr36_03939 [Pyricularia pennisetigena]TLS30665.1 hypothetical protein PpBr36_03939 [Pyricularia pennisetigena]
MPVYCVTGSNRGIGLELVRQISAQPDTTVLALTRTLSNDLSGLQGIKTSSNAKLHILECDIGNAESITNFASSVTKTLGAGAKIDVLINNSGVQLSATENSLSFDPADMTETFRINTVGPALVVQRLHAASALSPSARVVNISSGLGSMSATRSGGDEQRHMFSYSVSKAALNMLTVHQAGNLRTVGGLADAVVVALDPGWVQTRMGGDGAQLTPDESVKGILKTVAALKKEDNGAFFEYNGNKREW